MTNLEAIKSEVMGYPVSESTLKKILIDRSLNETEEYLGKSKAFDLCVADLYVKLISAANIDEGGYSVSMTDKSNIIKISNSIYSRYGEPSPLKERPQVKAARPW